MKSQKSMLNFNNPNAAYPAKTNNPPPTLPPDHSPIYQPTTRRVWVKRSNGTPTTLHVTTYDIVDDLKSLVLAKYPTTLARRFDPSDIIIRVEITPNIRYLQKTNPVKAAATTATNISANNSSSLQPHHTFPMDVSPVAPTPISAIQTPLLPKFPESMASFNPPPISESPANLTPSSITLEPDQLVYKVMDQYFPQGMSMQDAFLIEIPTQTNRYNQTITEGVSYSVPTIQQPPQQHHRGSVGTNNVPPSSYLPSPLEAIPPVIPSHGHSHSVSLSAIGSQSGTGHFQKERSLSPSMRRSPVPSRRTGLGNSSVQSPSSTAVLLLPKNFSLTNNDGEKKRPSVDESTPTTTRKTPNNITNIRDLKDGENNNYGYSEGSPKQQLPKIKTDLARNEPPEYNSSSDVQQKSGKITPVGKKGPKTTTEKVLPSINVLVVEDNAINQAILGAFLRKHKIRYKIAKNGQEAIEKWREGGFHLVLMDIQLPVISGIEATKEIRRLEKINRIGVFAQPELSQMLSLRGVNDESDKLDVGGTFRSPVIIVALTASTSSSDRKDALMAGCNDYLTKPVNLVWLQNKITEWGCMQALIDFDGWQSGERTRERMITINNGTRPKSLTRKNRIPS